MSKEIGKAVVKVGVDSTGFNPAISELNRKMKVVKEEFKTAASKMNKFTNSTEFLKSKSESLNNQMDMQKEKVELLRQKFEKSAEIKGKESKATQNVYIQYQKAQQQLSGLEKQLKDTNIKLEQQTNKWNKLSIKLKGVGDKFNAVGKKMSSIGKTLSTRITAPLTALGVGVVATGAKFETAMSEVKAISGATGEELEALKQKALEMGTKTSKSATESAEALKYMSLAGWDSKTSIEALEPILRLSEAGAMDLGLASDLVTDSMSSLGLTTKQLPGYLDQMAKTSSNSNTSIQQLGEAYVVAGGTIKNLNIPLSESNTLLGILANRGKKGSEAGTAFNSIMVNLTTGTGKAGKAMKELNLSAFDGEGKFKGVSVVLSELSEKTKGMTESQRNMYLSMIGGKTQLDILQALLDGVGKEYNSLKKDIQNSDGALDEMSKTMQNNLNGSLTSLKSALEGAAISVSDRLIPTIKKVSAKIKEWTDKFNKLSPKMKDTIVKIGLIVTAIGPLLFIGGKVTSLIGGSITKIGKLIGFMKKHNVVTKISTACQKALNLVMNMNPFAKVALVIGAVIVAFIALYKNSEKFRNFVNKLWKVIKDTFKKIGDTISNAWKNAIKWTADAWNKIKLSISKAIDKIKKTLSIWIQTLKDIFKKGFNGVKDVVKNIFNGLKDIIVNIVDGIVTQVKKVIDWVTKAIDKINIFKHKKSSNKVGGNIKVSASPKASSVNWYDTGGIFTSPSIIGVGEKRPEFVGALDDLRTIVKDVIKEEKGSGDIIQHITIQSNKALSPYEIRKQFLKGSRELAFEWGKA